MTDEPPPFAIPYKRVTIVWLDAYSDDHWSEISPSAVLEEHPCITTGWLIRENKSYVEVASTLGSVVGRTTALETAQTMVIPRKMIVSMVDM